jgi:hypothetical protein
MKPFTYSSYAVPYARRAEALGYSYEARLRGLM